jgi:hypothetical protein
MKIPPLGKVFWFCGANGGVAQDCVDWALEALCEGVDSPSLRILAGLEPLLNSFEVLDYTRRTLKELGISELVGEEAVLAYSRDLAEEIIERRESLRANLSALFRLCHTNDYLSEIYDFYLLECTYTDFDYQDVQYYWEGATKENIEGIVIKTCQTFIESYDQGAEPVVI